MAARTEVDIKNMNIVNNILKDYPDLLRLYINSLTNKTSYTKREYTYHLRKFMDWLKTQRKLDIFDESIYKLIKPMHIDGYIGSIQNNADGTKKSATYIVANIAAIKSFFNFLLKNELIDHNPCSLVAHPKANKLHKITTISDDDLKIMMDNIENGVGTDRMKSAQKKWASRNKAIVILGIVTALRVSAIVNINIEDIDFDNKFINVVEKGDRKRKVYIGDKVISAIEDWLYDRDEINSITTNALFISNGGKRMSVSTVERMIKRISAETGKIITPHKMRATSATRLYKETKDIYRVKDHLGHINIENTKLYTEFNEDEQKRSAEILDSLI